MEVPSIDNGRWNLGRVDKGSATRRLAGKAGWSAARVCDWVAPRFRAARRRLITTKERARGGEEGLTWGVCNGYSTEAILSGFTCSGFNCVGLSNGGTFAMLLARWACFLFSQQSYALAHSIGGYYHRPSPFRRAAPAGYPRPGCFRCRVRQ